MRLSVLINDLAEPWFISLRNWMEYLIRHPHELIMCSRNKMSKLNDIPHQYFFKAGSE